MLRRLKASDARIDSAKACFCACRQMIRSLSSFGALRYFRRVWCVLTLLDWSGSDVCSVCWCVFVPMMVLLGQQLFLIWAGKRPFGLRGTGNEPVPFRTELEPGAVRSEPLRSVLLCVCVRARDSIAKMQPIRLCYQHLIIRVNLRLFSCP